MEDYSQYGLDDPVCTIRLTAGEESWEILLGDYSTMDSQRYVSIGDGNVYLAVNDPLDEFDAALSDLILNDQVPDLDGATRIAFAGRRTMRRSGWRTAAPIPTAPTTGTSFPGTAPTSPWTPARWKPTCAA